MARKLLAVVLLSGVFFGYGSAIVSAVHGPGHCSSHRSPPTPDDAP